MLVSPVFGSSYRPLSEDEARIHTPVVISCNEHRREVAATQSIAGKHIDRHFAFDKVPELTKSCLKHVSLSLGCLIWFLKFSGLWSSISTEGLI